jgi:hypothetical protein
MYCPLARLATTGTPFAGPPPSAGTAPLFPGSSLDAGERRALHEAADAFDAAALAAPPALDGYGVLVDLGLDGAVAVEVAEADPVPLALRDVPWASGGCIAYRVHWFPPDLEDAHRERPSHAHVVARRRASQVAIAAARAVWAAVGGEIADEADFLVTPGDL